MRGAIAASLLVAVIGASLGVGAAHGAASGRSWQALIGNGWPTQQSGSNGLASIDLYVTGVGALHLKLRNLVRNTTYRLTLFKGPFLPPNTSWSGRAGGCDSVTDGTVIRLPARRTTTAGAIEGSIALSASQMTAINSLSRRIGLMVGSGRLERCGGFQLRPAMTTSPPPAASPNPTSSSGPSPSPQCSPWPPAIADILAVLTTPDGLCLRLYTTGAEAPPFLVEAFGIYFPDPPTIHHVIGTGVTETASLAHEVCHAHQDRVARDVGESDYTEGWYRTAPGADFVETTGWRLQGERWVEQRPEAISGNSSPLEDNAEICALWFDPSFGPRYLRRWVPVRFAWAQRWLPLPSFVVPWQGDSQATTADGR